MIIHRSVFSRIATLGFIGYLPGSGTIASLCMIPLFYFIRVPLDVQIVLIAIFFVVSFFIISKALTSFTDNDPSEIVLDECVGMFVAVYYLPFSWFNIFLAFILFRLLDISKFFGIATFERLPGAWGILLDDIVAACVTNIILRFIVPLACQ